MESLPIDRIIDLDTYPITDLESTEAKALIARAAERYAREGACLLPGFLRPGTVALMAAEADAVSSDAFRCDDQHNPYLEPDNPDLGDDHPRRRAEATKLDVLGCDQLSSQNLLMRLHAWQPLCDFLGRVLGYDSFHRFEDPVGAVTINVMNDGDGHGWHFDEAQFTISVMLQAPDSGGHFEYVPGLRGDDFDDYDGLARVLDGDRSGVTTIPITPGAMLLFGGRNLLHRVSRVEGGTTRHVSVLCYRDRPGMTNSPEVRQLFYGRTEPLRQLA
ncbi:MAG: hypothetical protein CMM46_03705 [Rhodospirillaceae bacterium]|nr:hypothetical protein [Rhodospirillaceae bacterium]|tara:strand:- start:1967 stop:2788 length:822 start_codon:yes stop_codon:yes gene_type:complete